MMLQLKYLLLPILLLIVFSGCKQSEESKIKNTSQQFIRGRIALEKGDSTELKAVTEDSLFLLIMLNEQYIKMLQAPVVGIGTELRMMSPLSVTINGDCATCLMSGFEHYEIDLCKYNGVWKVKGENEIYATSEKISGVRKKIADYDKTLANKPSGDSVLRAVNVFFDSTRRFFTKPDPVLLNKVCNSATKACIQKLYNISLRRADAATLRKEMLQENYLTGDPLFQTNRVVFKFYNEETNILLKKLNGNYIVTGFNGLPAEYISDDDLRANCLDYLRAMKLIRSKTYRDKNLAQ